MRVVAIGGAGAMGRVAVKVLANHQRLEELVVADRDLTAAQALAEPLGERVTAQSLDLNDRSSLTSVLDGADVVINTAGPFYRFGSMVLGAAIEAGCHYLDICDDPAPTLEMLEFDKRAQDAGVVAIIGMGASPGVSNLLARLAGDRLTQIERLVTGWPMGLEAMGPQRGQSTGPSAAAVHWVHQFSHPISVIKSGHRTTAEPLRSVELQYPDVGPGEVFTVGHPEAVTLDRAFPRVKECFNVMVISPDIVEQLRQIAAEVRGGISDEDGARQLDTRFAGDFRISDPGAPFAWLFALAEGHTDSGPATVAAGLSRYPRGGMAGITGVPLALAAGMVLEDQITVKGVHPPETSVPAQPFFAAMEPYLEGEGDVVTITTSS